MMPHLSGFDVLKVIKEEQNKSYPPIIIISAIYQSKTKTESFQLGAVDYLTKPFNRDELLARIHMHLTLARKESELEHLVKVRTKELQKSHLELSDNHQKLQKANKKLEETFQHLLHSEKMVSIGQLAAGVAHEINNPIGYIQSNVHTLKEYVQVLTQLIQYYGQIESTDHQSKTYQKILAKINEIKDAENIDFILEDIALLISDTSEGTDRVKAIVKGITGFARQEDDKMANDNINSAIDDSIKLVWNELKYKCQIEKNYGELPEVYCNRSQLIQVFTNLLVNAAQAIKENGTISINTSVCNTPEQNNCVLIQFSDTGHGISEKNQKKIFDPFFTTKDIGQGTGLGLYLSYEIIQKHQGEITIDSEVDKGTTFNIILPIKLASD